VNIPLLYMGKYREVIILCLVLPSTLGLAGVYATSWRYADVMEYMLMYIAIFGATMLSYALSRILVLNETLFAFSDYAIIAIICIIGYSIERFGGRIFRTYQYRLKNRKENAKKTRVMIVGAGDTGSALIRSMRKDALMYPVVAIDDDEAKHGMIISEVPIVGGRDKIISAAKEHKVQEIIIAIPSVKNKEYNDILKICRETGLKTSTVPSLFELVSGQASVTQIRKVTPQDLLGRHEEIIDGRDIFGYIEGKTVMVTGGGGSIGSELCRQIAKYNPSRLIIFDIYENNAYELQLELRKKYPELKLEVLIGSVRDSARLDEVFEKYKPRVVFHAAAHKHVPLMEDSPNEAIKNNVFGTYNVASACERFGAERFVLISTDKAVNPTNIMGTSKRIAEMVMQQFALKQKENGSKTVYAAVRFGNVLGSNGSVIPLFKKQIKEGGPVTVTHPEINRFFMTIPEAAQLVMQAGALAEGGEIFILDMGEPVKIVDLARNLIELSGYVPDVDIKIEFSGLRPGEKMYEELLLDKQRHTATKNNKIYIEQPINDSKTLVGEIFALRERLSCDIPIYDTMINWFEEKFF
ncbi:MAG: polysaccharide biosynthesis protein, partial [Clostridia bacterium]|nr:polysaccharide biosynthesis protein [Clostridia bacterium]